MLRERLREVRDQLLTELLDMAETMTVDKPARPAGPSGFGESYNTNNPGGIPLGIVVSSLVHRGMSSRLALRAARQVSALRASELRLAMSDDWEGCRYRTCYE